MATVTIPNTFTAATNAVAADVNANFTALAAGVNSIENENVAAAAAIVGSKLDLSSATILEDYVTFDGSTGHDHSGGTAGTLISTVTPGTGVAGVQGTINAVRGVTAVIAGHGTVAIDIESVGLSISRILSVSVIRIYGSSLYQSDAYYGTGGLDGYYGSSWHLHQDMTTLTVYNGLSDSYAYYYCILYCDA